MQNAKVRKPRSVLSRSNGSKPEVESAPVSLPREADPLLTAPLPAAAVELAQKIKELVRLAQEQGHLTYGDIHEVFPEDAVTPELLDEVYAKLQVLEIEIVDLAEVDVV